MTIPKPQPEAYPEVQLPILDAPTQASQLVAIKVSAGFSPSADYAEKHLDINDYLVQNAAATFFFRVQGDSMEVAQIFDGDILVVDKSIEPAHGHIVIAFCNEERLVRRLYKQKGRVALEADNPHYPPIEASEKSDLLIWGVVTGKFKRFPV